MGDPDLEESQRQGRHMVESSQLANQESWLTYKHRGLIDSWQSSNFDRQFEAQTVDQQTIDTIKITIGLKTIMDPVGKPRHYKRDCNSKGVGSSKGSQEIKLIENKVV